MKVSNPWGVPNQFIIHTSDGKYFQSYDSIIVFIPIEGPIQLGKDWKYSPTTSKYRNKFLGESTTETSKKLADGVYVSNTELCVGDKSKYIKLKKKVIAADSCSEESLDELFKELKEMLDELDI